MFTLMLAVKTVSEFASTSSCLVSEPKNQTQGRQPAGHCCQSSSGVEVLDNSVISKSEIQRPWERGQSEKKGKKREGSPKLFPISHHQKTKSQLTIQSRTRRVLGSICCYEKTLTKTNFGRWRVGFQVTAQGNQDRNLGRNLEAGTQAETLEGYCSLAYPQTYLQLPFLCTPGHSLV